MPRRKRPAPTLHTMERLRAELPDGSAITGEVTLESRPGFFGLRISVDPPDDEPPSTEEPPTRPIEER